VLKVLDMEKQLEDRKE